MLFLIGYPVSCHDATLGCGWTGGEEEAAVSIMDLSKLSSAFLLAFKDYFTNDVQIDYT
jgi:hypothetical protein